IFVYLFLSIAFLLPAKQHWDVTEKRSRVLVLLDVSESFTVLPDELPSAERPGEVLPTRMDKVLKFLSDEKVAFLNRLIDKNPVTIYRFGSRLDEEFATATRGDRPWGPEDWNRLVRMDLKEWVLKGVSDAGVKSMHNHAEFQGSQPGTVEWATQWLRLDD